MLKGLRITVFSLLALSISISSFSQKTITGRLIDEKGEALSYATVALLNPGDSTLRFFGVTNTTGKYQIKSIKEGKYIMQFSYVGMKVDYDNVNITSGSTGNYGDKIMRSVTLGEIEVIAEYIPITFKSDTVEYNAKAFETKPDAVAEDLLKKIPGIEVDESGNIKAQGEDVTKVLVDGKEFFGNDLKVATKNLPAKAIDKVQVYDKKSEEADFMGIDDGVRNRTINLLLNKDHKKGYFGNIEAGGSLEEYYKAEAKVYRFSTKLQTAILGMYNNINEFGYSSKGHQQYGQTVNGLNASLAGGLNMSYNVSTKRRYFFSYLASTTDKLLDQQTLTENFLKGNSYFQDDVLDEEETDSPHTLNFGVRHRFNPNSKLTIDGDADISSNSNLRNAYTSTSSDDTLINRLENTTNTIVDVINAKGKAVYIHKFNEEKTQIKTKLSANYDKNISEINLNNITYLFNPTSIDFIDQYQNNNTEELDLSVKPAVVQKFNQSWSLDLESEIGINTESLDRNSGFNNIILLISQVDNFKTERTYVNPELTIRRGTSQSQMRLTLGAGLNQFNKIYTSFIDVNSVNLEKSYMHFLPGFSYENSYRKGRRIKLRYRSSVEMPTVNQLLPIVNTINPLSLYQGNINLTPEYNHNLNLMWAIFDQFSFTSMFSRIGAGYTNNKISFSRYINDDFIQIITPVNVDYYYNAYSFVYFSTPIRKLGVKLNIRSNESWNQGISYINFEENINTSFTHTIKISVENRTKKKWDVNVGGSVSLTDSKFSIAESQNNIYYNTSYFSQLRFTPNNKWSFDTEGSMLNYSSKNLTESLSIPLLGASISYFFMKSEKASFTLRGFDLLDKSSNISQVASSNAIMYQQSNTIGRYIMLIFKMKIGKN